MVSEADLDADVKSLSVLSEHSELYEEFAKLGCVHSLVSLLAHENTDIAIHVVEVIDELTDEDVESEPAQWDALVNAMVWLILTLEMYRADNEQLEGDLLELLISNLNRFKEDSDIDRGGVYHALGK
jgi:beta-catenin-like protein 1